MIIKTGDCKFFEVIKDDSLLDDEQTRKVLSEAAQNIPKNGNKLESNKDDSESEKI